MTPKQLASIQKLGFIEPTERLFRTNPYTGKTCNLVPEAVMLYDFITTRKFVCGKDYTRQVWDAARMHFQIKWSNEYYDLLD